MEVKELALGHVLSSVPDTYADSESHSVGFFLLTKVNDRISHCPPQNFARFSLHPQCAAGDISHGTSAMPIGGLVSDRTGALGKTYQAALTLRNSHPMAPLFDTYDVQYAGSKDGAEVYKGKVDPKWSVGRWVSDTIASAIVKLTHFTPVSCLEVRSFCVHELDELLILSDAYPHRLHLWFDH